MISVAPAERKDLEAWSRLQSALWETSPEDSLERLSRDDHVYLVLLAWTEAGEAVGFAEGALRRDYVNGCETSPVVFLEGLYVDPANRHLGVARRLVAEVEAWARGLGVSELASDALLDNTVSHRMHAALGFEETERVVYFRKPLA